MEKIYIDFHVYNFMNKKAGIAPKTAFGIVLLVGGLYLIMENQAIVGFLFLAGGFALLAWE